LKGKNKIFDIVDETIAKLDNKDQTKEEEIQKDVLKEKRAKVKCLFDEVRFCR